MNAASARALTNRKAEIDSSATGAAPCTTPVPSKGPDRTPSLVGAISFELARWSDQKPREKKSPATGGAKVTG
jgi:hypothetical protein